LKKKWKGFSWGKIRDFYGRKFVIQGFIRITQFLSEALTLLQAKMAQQAKHVRVGGREGTAVRLVFLANGKDDELEKK
jgi:hypothetical protein